MQLVGYSNFAQKTFESNAILYVKIFGGKTEVKRYAQRRGNTSCLVAAKVVETSKDFGCTSTPRYTLKTTKMEGNTINKKNKKGPMNSHNDMTF